MAEPSGGGGGGALVPSVVKTSVEEDVTGVSSRIRESTPPPPLVVVVENQGDESGSGLGKHETTMTEKEAGDKDLLCPICMEVIKDAFLTMCGHNFCYGCISTHLHNKNDCPSCGHYLTTSNIYPNFLLNKLLKNASLHQIAKTSSPAEHLRLALQQGYNLSVQELDSLIYLLTDKKRKREQEEAETNMQILLEFLNCLRKQKIDELSEVQKDLQFIKADLNSVERHRMELHHVSEKYSVKLRMVHDNSFKTKLRSPMVDQHDNPMVSNTRNVHIGVGSRSLYDRKVEMKPQLNFEGLQRKETFCGSDPTHSLAQSGLAVARKRRIHQQFNELQECYLQRRRHGLNLLNQQEEKDSHSYPNAITRREGYHTGLEDFQYVLSTFTRYSRLRVIAELRLGDFFHSANIVSRNQQYGLPYHYDMASNSPIEVFLCDELHKIQLWHLLAPCGKYFRNIEFDRDNELFATAGVSKCIKVFEFSTVVNDPTEVHCPVVEMSTKSKLSCLSWNKYTKNIIASSDYEGIVTVWDVNTRQSVMEYEEHEKRAWSVDFSRTEPSMLVSGSDDCTVKIWCTKQETSVFNIDMKANICCVKYNPGSGVHVAIGSADHNIHYYDLRNISTPLHVFKGHKKAVSYVKFLSTNELASASTDSTLRLWDVQDNCPAMIFKGHTNEKNFVGLTVNKDYLACGSETNEVFVYQKAISKPAASHKFGSFNLNDVDDDSSSYFISAVCWKSDSPTLLTANSQGAIKVLVLAT